MASIKGIEIKNIKTFRGEEYPRLYQGTVYFKGNKLGFWSQDSWGGPDRYDFDITELNKVSKKYYGVGSISDLDTLLSEIILLNDYEKKYKNAVNAGYKSIVILTDGFKETCLKVPKETKKDAVLKICEAYIKTFENASNDKDRVKTLVFTSPKDFTK